MSESSTEIKQPETPEAPKAENKVPVEAVAKERAEKRAARAEADAAKQELAKLKEQTPDPDELLSAFNNAKQAIKAEAEAAVTQQLAPFKAEAAKWKSAAALGLNEPQADALMEVKAKYQGMPDAQALMIARTEKPDLFPRVAPPSFAQSAIGGIPPGGDSPFRSAGQQDDFMAKMQGAKDQSEKTHWAEQEFMRRIQKLRPQNR